MFTKFQSNFSFSYDKIFSDLDPEMQCLVLKVILWIGEGLFNFAQYILQILSCDLWYMPSLTKLKCWQNACITPAKRKQCLQNAGETILCPSKLWQNASKVQFLPHNEQQMPVKCKQTRTIQAKCWQILIIIIIFK